MTYNFLHRHFRDRATSIPFELMVSPLAVDVVSESSGRVKESTVKLQGRKGREMPHHFLGNSEKYHRN